MTNVTLPIQTVVESPGKKAVSDQRIEIPAGLLAITTYGSITAETFQAMMDMQRHCFLKGITNISVATVSGNLVDKARNEAARQMLVNPNLKWLWFLDADMSFHPTLAEQILVTAFAVTPWADMVGAWCPLRGKPYLPTIDTGTGTWEPHDAGLGPLEVIRTGAACVLIKRHVFEALEFPWYGVRPAPRPIDALMEVDNYARCKHDGRNPLRDHAFWQTLEACAKQDAASQRANPATQVPGGFLSSVGEDSNFCDKARAAGFRIVVQTDAVCEHLERRPITPADHVSAMKESERFTKLAAGITA